MFRNKSNTNWRAHRSWRRIIAGTRDVESGRRDGCGEGGRRGVGE